MTAELWMSKRERVRAAIQGKPVDRVPISFWRHFPGRDMMADSLAELMLTFQRTYDLDFIKMMPVGLFSVIDFGCKIRVYNDLTRPPDVAEYRIKRPEDWETLEPVPVDRGHYLEQINAIRMVREELADEDVPIVETVFSPLTTARKMAGDERLFTDLREHPEAVHQALRAITETTQNFARAACEAGADGIFFATQCATSDLCTREEYAIFGRPYDLAVLNALPVPAQEWSILHIHGLNIFFDDLLDYPVAILNWHDRRTAPTLKAARQRTLRCLAGGINDEQTILYGDEATIAAEVRDAIAQVQGERLIVAPGCVVPTTTPAGHLHAARAAVNPAGAESA
jgi:uroporphyrinogen decarboxylase